jgi:hypothetical protein
MLKVQNPIRNETFSALLSMGYKPEMISLAMDEAQNPSLEEVLDLLLFRESTYNRALESRSNRKGSAANQNIFQDLDNQKSRKNSHKNKSKNEEKKPAQKKESFQEELVEEKPAEPLNPLPKEPIVPLPKSMDENCAIYLNNIRKSLNHIDSKDPREYVAGLAEHLKTLKFDTTEVGSAVHKYLSSGSHFSQVVDLRKKVYEVIMKIMTMKRQCDVNIQDFEYTLLMSFETRVLNAKQMDIILSTYSKFCNKLGHSQDDTLVSSLERLYSEAKKAHLYPNGLPPQDLDQKLLTDFAILKCPNVTSVKFNEESKASDAQIEAGKLPAKKGSQNHSEKEFCIICMAKTREIVFLPCCHFLTCPKCSPSVSKCPICYKKIEKNLKIFWS